MPVKITLEDGREFHVGQEVEVFLSNRFVKRILDLYTSTETINISWIIEFPSAVRAPKAKRPMTAKEVWNLLQTGVEWKCEGTHPLVTFIGGSVVSGMNHDPDGLFIGCAEYKYDIYNCLYRTEPDQPWQKFEVEE